LPIPLVFNISHGIESFEQSQLVLNLTWQVVSGEESKDMEFQNQREIRVLEAVYPRPSAIPPKFATFLFASLTLFLSSAC